MEGVVLINSNFYKGKNILMTGHTGFKGSWMCVLLDTLGANIYGYSLEPPTNPSLYKIANIDSIVNSHIGDIRNYSELEKYFNEVSPDIVIHMAAQPLVLEGYNNPRYTYEVNTIGTVNILECVRKSNTVKSFLNVTTDKVYKNLETDKYYIESDELNGYDPYSNSKSCSELITYSYRQSFKNICPMSTARAGNVIGGGDFADNRIIPDCVRAALSGHNIKLRNPNSIRPYQHVLEPLHAYLSLIEKQYYDWSKEGAYNIGPKKEDCITTKELAEMFCKHWGCNLECVIENIDGPHEANYLKLNVNKISKEIGFNTKWNSERAVVKTIEWTKEWVAGNNTMDAMKRQITEYNSA